MGYGNSSAVAEVIDFDFEHVQMRIEDQIVATQIRSTFTLLRFDLMMGNGGSVPSAENKIRFGDIVVSKPTGIIGRSDLV